jgi:hypothetical protein
MAARINGAVLRDDTIQRLGGQGDNWYSTLTSDGSLYVALCDGSGFRGLERKGYNSRLFRVDGTPETGITFHDVPGFPDLIDPPLEGIEAYYNKPPRYYGFGTIAIGDTIYQYLSTWNLSTEQHADAEKGAMHFVGAKLIYSPDKGETWYNQDGTTPVAWEDWGKQQGSLVFFEEDEETFSLFSILQMGAGYSLNKDGYVYVYAPNGNDEGNMNELVMFRVPTDRILERGAYEYFAGWDGENPTWSSDLTDRKPVHTFPSGWVNLEGHPYAWQPSITYNPGLDTYLMANWATGLADDLEWFGKESYLGLYQSDTPWGPWRQFHEDTSWGPGGDTEARCYQPQIIPNWISEDGKSFWMVWTDFQTPYSKEEAETKRAEIIASDASRDDKLDALAAMRPHYAFNLQKVELTF